MAPLTPDKKEIRKRIWESVSARICQRERICENVCARTCLQKCVCANISVRTCLRHLGPRWRHQWGEARQSEARQSKARRSKAKQGKPRRSRPGWDTQASSLGPYAHWPYDISGPGVWRGPSGPGPRGGQGAGGTPVDNRDTLSDQGEGQGPQGGNGPDCPAVGSVEVKLG